MNWTYEFIAFSELAVPNSVCEIFQCNSSHDAYRPTCKLEVEYVFLSFFPNKGTNLFYIDPSCLVCLKFLILLVSIL